MCELDLSVCHVSLRWDERGQNILTAWTRSFTDSPSNYTEAQGLSSDHCMSAQRTRSCQFLSFHQDHQWKTTHPWKKNIYRLHRLHSSEPRRCTTILQVATINMLLTEEPTNSPCLAHTFFKWQAKSNSDAAKIVGFHGDVGGPIG